MRSENLNYRWASLLIDELIRNGIDYFCIAPGSRSAPLAVCAGQSSGRSTVWIDERGAAFHALGYARATGRAAAVIVTSGTAVANCLPAVVEASMDCVPLIILSADRPPELQRAGAHQTILQDNIFGEYVRWHCCLPCPDESLDPAMVLTAADQAAFQANQALPGPVHLNCPFREPLAPLPQPWARRDHDPVEDWTRSGKPFTTYAPSRSLPSEAEIQAFAETLSRSERGMLFAGGHPGVPAESLLQLAEKLQWPVCADITSGLRLGHDSPQVIHHMDLLLQTPAMGDLMNPEIIVRFGNQPTSKRFAEFQSGCRPHTAVVTRHPFRDDPQHQTATRVVAEPELFCRALEKLVPARPASPWLAKIQAANQAVDALLDEMLLHPSAGLSEPGVARLLSRLAAGSDLFLASSLSIREMDRFAARTHRPIAVAANRGASGIDGTLASALGFAQGRKRPVTLLIGDLALLHDLSSLAGLTSTAQPLIVVLLNNQGGGIFSFLPIAQFPDLLEPWFAAPQRVAFAPLAAAFGIDYAAPQSLAEFASSYQRSLAKKRPALIEIRTERQANHALQQQLQLKIAQQLEGTAGRESR